MAYVCVIVEVPDEDWQRPEVDDLADALVMVAVEHRQHPRLVMGKGAWEDPREPRPGTMCA